MKGRSVKERPFSVCALCGRGRRWQSRKGATVATKEKTAGKRAEGDKPDEQGGDDSGKRDIVAEQESAEKSAQELVQERHMNPDAFK